MSAPVTSPPTYRTADAIERRSINHLLAEAAGAGVSEVRITPARYGNGRVWCAMALGYDRREIPLQRGAAASLAAILRQHFSRADWTRPQDYWSRDGSLREHVVRIPECLSNEVLTVPAPDQADGSPTYWVPASKPRVAKAVIKHGAVAAEAAAAPGTWVRAGSYGSDYAAATAARRVRDGAALSAGSRSWYAPAGRYESRCEQVGDRTELWVRYRPDTEFHPAPRQDFSASVDGGFTETFEDYCARTATSPTSEGPTT
ncbi:hypothetical protein [Streptomyces sp. C10-9-1]|uniref:hypothetical protein n=1 Tax=Streptomyces sp. C10-9-1 TaxID=1859285 RepID=UPI003F49C8C4